MKQSGPWWSEPHRYKDGDGFLKSYVKDVCNMNTRWRISRAVPSTHGAVLCRKQPNECYPTYGWMIELIYKQREVWTAVEAIIDLVTADYES